MEESDVFVLLLPLHGLKYDGGGECGNADENEDDEQHKDRWSGVVRDADSNDTQKRNDEYSAGYDGYPDISLTLMQHFRF